MTASRTQAARPWAEGLFLVALSLWVGAVVFYSLIVLPALFSAMPSARAGEVAALVFPPYYSSGLIMGGLMLASSGYLASRVGGPWRWALAASALMVVAQALAAFGVGPRMAELRNNEAARATFMRLHVLAMVLNTLVMAVGLGLLVAARRLLGPRVLSREGGGQN